MVKKNVMAQTKMDKDVENAYDKKKSEEMEENGKRHRKMGMCHKKG
jgi:hypothetical protein